MGALTWLQLVEAEVAKLATDEVGREELTQRFRESLEYEIAWAQKCEGASERVLRNLVRAALLRITRKIP